MKKCVFKQVIVVSLFLLFIAGCSSADSNSESEESDDATEKEDIETYPFPLTGELTDDLEATQKRPVAVMISNDPNARPQSGLNEADLIYEVLTEGSITRYLAIFQSERPETIGPVRSARDYFIDLANGYHALYIAHGWSPQAQEILQSGMTDHLNGLTYDGTLFERATFRRAPHNSYISFENIEKGAEMNGFTLEKEVESLPFLTETDLERIEENDAAETVTVTYQRQEVTYKYDSTTELYTRYDQDQVTVDLETNDAITLANILIIEAKHDIIDQAGRRAVNLTSGGDALLLQKGMLQRVQWENQNGRIVPISADGPVGFIPGKTWINIIPEVPGINEDVIVSISE